MNRTYSLDNRKPDILSYKKQVQHIFSGDEENRKPDILSYKKQGSYISSSGEEYRPTVHSLLPEKYDIFSKVDSKYFCLNDTDQHYFLSLCLCYFKRKLVNTLLNHDMNIILPKLNLTFDKDNAYTLNWAYVNFRIYLNFEHNVYDSYYGIIKRVTDEKILTESGKINQKNYTAIIDTILTNVLENS